MMTKPSYLGFDFSTQQLKVVAVDEDLNTVYENSVSFDAELSHYKTEGGVIRNDLTVTAPTIMWVEAVDLLLEKAKADAVDFSAVKAISGAGQQHGTVYWKRGALQTLQNLNPSEKLAHQLEGSFSRPCGPVWMDSSTSAQCHKFEEAVGGPLALADLTGSPALERYSGPQILKFKEENPTAYANTERISLVSSFAASLFCGAYAHIEISDGSGMNLMDVRTKKWNGTLCQLIGAELPDKLDTVQTSETVAGTVSEYFVQRYGFPAGCQVVNFTGDNPGSLAGMRLQEGDVCLSLGTSDVVILSFAECPGATEYPLVFGNPCDSNVYMGIFCFKNGSLVRNRLRDAHAGSDWSEFEKVLRSTPKGNGGKIGMYFDEMEIIPHNRRGTFRFDADDTPVATPFSPAEEVRALVEGQLLSRALHAQLVCSKLRAGSKLLVTGGASVNKELMQVAADIFGLDVYNLDVANSAALGSAYRAKHALAGGAFQSVVEHLRGYQLIARPDPDAAPVYARLRERYRRLEAAIKPSPEIK